MRGRRPHKTDANQADLVFALRQIPGVSVFVASHVSQGFPDLVIGFRGVTYLAEVKDPAKPPSRRRLTDEEAEFHDNWTGQVAVVETLDDVLRLIGAKM